MTVGDFLFWAGYGGVILTLVITLWASHMFRNIRGRHFGAAAIFPFVIGLFVVAVIAVLAAASNLIFGWRWPVQAYGVFPTSLVVLAPLTLSTRRIWKRR